MNSKILREPIPMMVSVRCTVYNHEKYLRDCLQGFVMQKTNFPFEVIVHDDASTDNSVAIIKEYVERYPDIIKPIFEKENQYSKHDGSIRRIMDSACRGKYIAICEGDDFWTDPYKLQKQIDYMENHPESEMTYTDFSIKNEIEGKEYLNLFKTQPKIYPYKYTMEQWILSLGYVAPMTWVIKKTLYNARPLLPSLDGSFVDFAFYLSKTNPYCLYDDNTATYRIIPESASHSKSFEKLYNRFVNLYNTQLLLSDMYLSSNVAQNEKEKIKTRFYDWYLHYAIIANDDNMIDEIRKFYGEADAPLKQKILFWISENHTRRSVFKTIFLRVRRCFRKNSF